MSVEILVLAKVANLDSQKILHVSSNVVALQDLRSGIHRPFKRASVFMELLCKPDHDKDRYARGKSGTVNDGTVALDHPCTFEFLHPAQAS